MRSCCFWYNMYRKCVESQSGRRSFGILFADDVLRYGTCYRGLRIAFIDLDYFSKSDKVIYLANLALLLAVIFFGKSSNNAVRWIKIGPITIQPSEFAKVIMIFCMANFIDKKKDSINNINVILRLCIAEAIPVLLVFVQPALSASIVIMVIFCIQMFVSELDYRFIFKVLIIVVPVVVFVVWDCTRENPILINHILKDYMIARVSEPCCSGSRIGHILSDNEINKCDKQRTA